MAKNKKIALVSFIIGLAASFALRLVMITTQTDMRSGFLYHESEVWMNILYFGSICAAAVVCAAFGGKIEKTPDLAGKRAVIAGIFMLLVACAAVYDLILQINAEDTSAARVIVGIISAVYPAAAAYALLYKKKFTPGLAAAYGGVGIIFLIRAIMLMITRPIIAPMPELLANVLTELFAAIFLVLFGRVASGNPTRVSDRAMVFWGTAAGCTAVSAGLGTIAAKLFAPSEISARITESFTYADEFFQQAGGADAYIMTFMPYIDLAAGIFAAAALICVLGKKPD